MMKRIKGRGKFLSTALLAIAILSAFTGCGNVATRRQVKEYVEQKLGITNYEIAHQRGGEVSFDSWLVYDKNEDVHFEVYETLTGSGDYIPTITSGIGSNYTEKLVERRACDLPENIDYLAPQKDSEDPELGSFVIHYKNKDELETSCRAFWDCATHIRSKDEKPIYFCVAMDTSVGTNPNSIDYSVWTYDGHVGPAQYDDNDYEDSCDSLIANALCPYITYGIAYQDAAVLQDIGEDNVPEYIRADHSNRVLIVDDPERAFRGDPEDEPHIGRCDGEITRRNATCLWYRPTLSTYRIPYGGLYVLLQSEGKNVEGDTTHFTYTSDTGDVYEFSDEFLTFYRKNGEDIETNLAEQNCVDHDIILEISGLYVDAIYYPYIQRDCGLNYGYAHAYE